MRPYACVAVAAAAVFMAAGAAAADADEVVIEMGDQAITRSALDERFSVAVRLLARRQGVSLADQDPALIETLRLQYLDKHVTELVMLAEARRRQLIVSDAQVDAALGELFASDEEVDALVAELPLEAAAAHQLLERIIREEQTVELVTEQLLLDIRIPPGDVITLHHDVKDRIATPEEVCVRHIQSPDREMAESIRQQLEAGADFAALAAELSTDAASAPGGGDLGCFERGPAGARTAFEQAAFGATEGDLVGPVESRFGYHVLVVYEHRMPRAPTLNEAYAQIERDLALEQLPERIKTLIEQSGIKVYPDKFS